MLLEQNYRSTSTIVAASSSLVAQNSNRVPKRVYSEGAPGEKIVVASCRNVHDESRYLITTIRELLSYGTTRPKDIAILFRTSKTGVAVQAALASARLPFNSHAANLWETAPVRGLTSVLTTLLRPDDDDAFEGAVQAISPQHASALLTALHEARGGSFKRGGEGQGRRSRWRQRRRQGRRRATNESLRAVAERLRSELAAAAASAAASSSVEQQAAKGER